jgi:hypothetical protein
MLRLSRSFALSVAFGATGGIACQPAAVPLRLDHPDAVVDDRAAADEARLRLRLSAYEPGSCAEAEAGLTDPVGALLAVVAHEPAGGVPVAAARCLVTGHLAEAEPEIARWLVTPADKGLALAVLRSLEQLPDEDATRLGRVLLSGPFAELARARLSKSARPALQSLTLEVLR